MALDDTRSRILEAAGVVFADHGYRDSTVREICRLAGVNLASVNYHFGDKRQLYLETVRYAYQSRMEDIPYPDLPATATAAEKLGKFITTIVSRMMGLEEAPWTTRLLTREVLHPTAACKDIVEEYFRPTMDRLLAILEEFLPPGTPKHKLHKTAFSVMGQCLLYRVAGEVVTMMVPAEELQAEYSVQQLAEHILEFSLAALQWKQAGRERATQTYI